MLGNNINRSVAPKSLFESAKSVIDNTVTIKQGSLVCLIGGLLALAAAETDGATFLGVMRESVVDGKSASPYNTAVVASQAINDIPGPVYGVIAKLTLKTGETINPGADVFLDPATGADGVAASGTKSIGIYQGAPIVGSAAGQQVLVLVGARAIDDTLKF
jgi:hypothetical protein